jgi:hypothetical protein
MRAATPTRADTCANLTSPLPCLVRKSLIPIFPAYLLIVNQRDGFDSNGSISSQQPGVERVIDLQMETIQAGRQLLPETQPHFLAWSKPCKGYDEA